MSAVKQAMAFASRANIRTPVLSIPSSIRCTASSAVKPCKKRHCLRMAELRFLRLLLLAQDARCTGVKAESHQWVNSDSAFDHGEGQPIPNQVVDEQCQAALVGNIVVDRGRQNMDLIDRPVAKSLVRHSKSSNNRPTHQVYQFWDRLFDLNYR